MEALLLDINRFFAGSSENIFRKHCHTEQQKRLKVGQVNIIWLTLTQRLAVIFL